MGILSGNQQEEPLNYGEISGIWQFTAGEKGMVVAYQTFMNHVGDEELKQYLQNKIENEMKPQIQECEDVLKGAGIALPPSPPEKATANSDTIPPGAKFNDPEISMTVAKNIGTGLVTLSQLMAICTREDIATMCERFHAEKAQQGLKMLRMQKEKGWLVPPPLHTQIPERA